MTSFDLTTRDALFLDFDGTLAELQDDAAAVSLTLAQESTVLAAAIALDGALAVLSGRDIADLALRVPNNVLRIGNHGLYTAEPGEPPGAASAPPPDQLVTLANEAVQGMSGTWIEVKGPILAIHYRAAPGFGVELQSRLAASIDPVLGYTLQSGKFVYELKPAAANKGVALEIAMARPAFAKRRPVMIGDDATDEDAFESAQSMGGIGIKVGAGPTRASARLASISEVYRLLDKLTKVNGTNSLGNTGQADT
jgi:trehalose 6-phosphate phosphatase